MLRLFKTRNITHQQIYLWSLVLVAVSLPTSKALMSIAPFITLVNWLWEGGLSDKFRKLKSNPAIWLLPSVFGLYLIGLLWTDSLKWGLHDIKIQIPLIILPVIIGTSKPLGFKNIKLIFLAFVGAVLFASFCSIWVWLGFSGKEITNVREISVFISHIRFALLINVGIFSLIWFVFNLKLNTPKIEKIIYLAVIVWLSLFLLILKSVTGIVVFLVVSSTLMVYLAFRVKHIVIRFALFVFILMVPVFIGAYITRSINKFYTLEVVSEKELNEKTKLGNPYYHEFENKQLENGHYVFLFLCEDELRQAWNQRSRFDYDTIVENGYNKYALFRYLTSKGLRKDAEGISKLNGQDIANIEKSIANYKFADKLSLSNRVYQTIWEFDMYRKGANPAGSSVVQRFEYYKIAWSVIREHFWFGTGTGGYRPAYEKKFDEHQYFKDPKFRQRSHNMFLSYWVDFGIVGLIFVCFAYTYPVFRQKKQKSYLLLVFGLIVLLSFLNEDTLNNHDAIVFFTLFYPLFLFGKYENGPVTE